MTTDAAESAAARNAAPPLAPKRRGPFRRAGAHLAAKVARRLRRLSDQLAFSSITSRIWTINLMAMIAIVLAFSVLEQYRADLIKIRTESLMEQATIAAAQLSLAATTVALAPTDRGAIRDLLRSMEMPVGVTLRVYDPSGQKIADSLQNQEVQPVAVIDHSAALPRVGYLGDIDGLLRRYARLLEGPRPAAQESQARVISADPAVYHALRGRPGSSQSYNSQGQLILTVVAPIRRVKHVRGAVALSTIGGDIDAIFERQEQEFLWVLAGVFVVLTLVSIALAVQIAAPLTALAKAAKGGVRIGNPERIHIPAFPGRSDEVSNLAGAFTAFKDSLTARIEASDRFAADVAHEIKNPLSSMRSAVESLRAAKDPERRATLLDLLEHDVRRLDRLVTDIARASRLEGELVRGALAAVDLAALLRTVAEIAAPMAAERGVRVEGPPPDGLRAEIRAQEGRIAQVFLNLIDNAVSFSPEGGVVEIALSAAPNPDGWRVAVRDQGPGVDPSLREKIFGRFYTERPAAEAFGQHSGLGLNIARQIVEAHGGRIFVDDRPGGGAVFVVELPA